MKDAEKNKKNTFDMVYEQVLKIPRGKVATYGTIARLCGNVRLARVVGYALHVNPLPGVIPCHRVVNRFGEVCKGFAFGGEGAQRAMLEDEGIKFNDDGRIDLEIYGYNG